MLKEEFRRAFFSWSFLLAIAITFAAAITGLLEYGPPVSPFSDSVKYPFNNNAFDAFIYGMGFGGPLPLFAPLIAVLPFAASFVTDRSSGYISFILSRTTFRKYITSKLFANLLAGGISLSVPLLIMYGVINIFYPRGLPPVPAPGEAWTSGRFAWAQGRGPFGYLYRTKPDLYILSLIGIVFLWGIAYATLGMALSLFIHNKYRVLAAPFVIYVIAHFVICVLGIERWSPLYNFAPFMLKTTSYITTFGEIGIISITSTICIFMFAKKKRVYE